MLCPNCNHIVTYTLSTGQKKCARCKKKFSPKKLERAKKIAECFVLDLTALEASKELQLNYLTVKKQYENIRIALVVFLEERYQRESVTEYDEYIYLEKSKRRVKENIFDAHNFLTFSYKDKIYSLLMPSLHKYKNQLHASGTDQVYFKEFSRFMMFNKIAKIQKRENTITRFWNFFENYITRYKGIQYDNFFYYLKECEFKFNYTKEEQREILRTLSF